MEARQSSDVAGEMEKKKQKQKQKQEKKKVLFRRARPGEDETMTCEEDPPLLLLLMLSRMDGPSFTFP